VLLEAHFPVFAGFGQFRPHILPLEKQANRIRTREMLCIPQKLIERRTGAGGDDVETFCRRCFHARILDSRIQFESVAHSLQKGALFGDGFEKCDPNAISQKLSQNKSRETSAAAEIGEGSGIGRDVFRQLSAIPDMPPPDIGQGPRRNKVVAGVPVLQHSDIGLQPG